MAAAAGNDDSATRSTSVGPPAAVLLPELEDERLCLSLWGKRVGRVFFEKVARETAHSAGGPFCNSCSIRWIRYQWLTFHLCICASRLPCAPDTTPKNNMYVFLDFL
jgi:hypothetical protein